MQKSRLYHGLILSVLLSFGCGGEDAADTAEERAQVVQDEKSKPAQSPGPSSSADGTVILFLGDSITAGYGLDEAQAFPALIQQKIDSIGWDMQAVNGGLSGETSAGGLRRVDWLLQQSPDILVLELGGNDGLRGIPPETTKENLKGIIEKTRAANPDVEIILAGMQIPPNLGAEYAERFRSVFPELAREENVHLIPFVLEGVGGIRNLNQSDGIHPTAAGHRIVAENVWQVLHPLLESTQEEPAV